MNVFSMRFWGARESMCAPACVCVCACVFVCVCTGMELCENNEYMLLYRNLYITSQGHNASFTHKYSDPLVLVLKMPTRMRMPIIDGKIL